MGELHRTAVVTDKQVPLPDEQAHVGGPNIVGVLDDLSETLESIAREESSAIARGLECLRCRTR